MSASGAEAVQLVRCQRPDLVIVSAELPDMSGAALCNALRKQLETAETPIILIHPDPNRSRRMAALSAGADDVLPRPIDETMLLARIRSLLRARHANDELRLREDARRALGMADPPGELQAPARVGLVAVQADIGLRAASLKLRDRLPHRFEILSPEQALRDEGARSEVLVIIDTGSVAGSGLSLLTQLRASPAQRHAGIIYVTRSDHRREAASALDLGADDLLPDGLDPEELALRLPRQIARKRAGDRLRATMRHGLRAAVTDPLTGLYNRRYAMPHIARLAERAILQQRPYALLAVDLDHFKRINDGYGHAAGDTVLREVAQRMTGALRAADLVARIGGEEFLVAMPDTDEHAALVAAERLRVVIAGAPFDLPDQARSLGHITASIGIAVPALEMRENPELVLDRADRALYSAKRSGRNRTAVATQPTGGFFEPDMTSTPSRAASAGG
ncbi:diguanylate cyclase response regulator [Salipiger pallidus]|uniref:diguanylate cyclase n=2 Tax=Salipiger pallidus TaxID=1775170 RepID=A0A8J3EGX3_9RHOB|nr:diguanylate cyclase response regulator [Salipiger pallidus]